MHFAFIKVSLRIAGAFLLATPYKKSPTTYSGALYHKNI